MVKYQMIDCEKCDLVYRTGSKHVCKTYCVNCSKYYKLDTKHTCRYGDCENCRRYHRIGFKYCSEESSYEIHRCYCGCRIAFDEGPCVDCLKERRETQMKFDDWKMLSNEYKKDCQECGVDLREYYDQVEEIQSHNICNDCEKD